MLDLIALASLAPLLPVQGTPECDALLTLAPESRFGADLARSGNVLVVGDPRYPVPGTVNEFGAVFVYERAGTDAPWLLATTLFEPGDGPPTGHDFGLSVAVDGERIAVGAPERQEVLTWEGAAYVFERVGGSWQLEQAFAGTPPGPGFPETTYSFGYDVALAGDRLFVASAVEDGFTYGEEALYYFRRGEAGWALVEREDIGSSSFGEAFGPGLAGNESFVAIQTRSNEFAQLDGLRVFSVRKTGLFELPLPAGSDVNGLGFNLSVSGETLAACYQAAGAAKPYALLWDLTDLTLAPGRADSTSPGQIGARVSVSLEGSSLVLRSRGFEFDWIDRFDLANLSAPVRSGSLCLESTGSFGIDTPVALDGDRVLASLPESAPGRIRELLPGAPGSFTDGAVLQRELPISKSDGALLTFELQFDAALAGQPAWLLGSTSGTSPGVPTPAGVIPLVPDGYTQSLLLNPTTGVIPNALGLLDATGRREVPLTLLPNVLGAMAGLEIVHAAIALDPATFDVLAITDTVTATVVP